MQQYLSYTYHRLYHLLTWQNVLQGWQYVPPLSVAQYQAALVALCKNNLATWAHARLNLIQLGQVATRQQLSEAWLMALINKQRPQAVALPPNACEHWRPVDCQTVQNPHPYLQSCLSRTMGAVISLSGWYTALNKLSRHRPASKADFKALFIAIARSEAIDLVYHSALIKKLHLILTHKHLYHKTLAFIMEK